MFKKPLYIIIFSIVIFITLFIFSYNTSTLVKSAPASHVVISEIQVGGSTSTDEFVELYNPTGSSQDLSGWKIMKKTASGTEDLLIITITSGSIDPHGYFLAAHSTAYDGGVTADVTYGEDETVSANNTILLYDETDSLVDKVGMGSAGDFEGTGTASSPANDRSIERKAYSTSTKASMEAGGEDEFAGNGEDTDDNDVDFIYRTLSDPQGNSSSAESPTESPTETTTPTEEISPTPTEEVSPTPTTSPAPSEVNVVISEIQLAGTTSKDEFIELYNPDSEAVDLEGFRLTRKTSTGTESNLVSSMTGSIATHGYLLITNPDYDGTVAADLNYSATTNSVSDDNTVILYSDAGVTVVDKVGLGSATDVETAAFPENPTADASIERKALETSTVTSMSPGGADEFAGNGYDSDNNSTDFILRDAADPQNSGSGSEPSQTTPTPTATQAITPTPSVSPTPTESLTPTPSETETPTPTESPTPTPTESPTPSPQQQGMVIGVIGFPGNQIVCRLNYKIVRVGFLLMVFPYVSCN
jgi:outer membrane biosynthesis protein TonB